MSPADDVPLLFCHYGNKRYLRYVLACARLSNPDKPIVLLGDDTNRRTARRAGVRHEPFEAFAGGELLETFHRVYRRVREPADGPMRGGRDWQKFVFQRWFHVQQFVRAEGIGPFWHFDSDNMLLVALREHEARFEGVDGTEQCSGRCLNGYVRGPEVLEAYLRKTNAIFEDEATSQSIAERIAREEPESGYTEMHAFEQWRSDEHPTTVRLNAEHDGATFDDCVCHAEQFVTEVLPGGRRVKAVHLHPDGRFFGVTADEGRVLWFHSLNLSWVPHATFDIVLRHRQTFTGPTAGAPDPAAGDTLGARLAAGEGQRLARRLWRRLRGR